MQAMFPEGKGASFGGGGDVLFMAAVVAAQMGLAWGEAQVGAAGGTREVTFGLGQDQTPGGGGGGTMAKRRESSVSAAGFQPSIPADQTIVVRVS